MAAAMVASLVPATAFAASGDVKATAKVIDAKDLSKGNDRAYPGQDDGSGVPDTSKWAEDDKGPELQLRITSADYQQVAVENELEVRLYLDNAEWAPEIIGNDTDGDDVRGPKLVERVSVREESQPASTTFDADTIVATEVEEDSVLLTFTGNFEKDDVIAIDMDAIVTKTSIGTKATVSVESDAVNADDLVFATVVDKGIKASIRKTVDVAVEEVATLRDLKIESLIGNFDTTKDDGVITVKLSKGFEFVDLDGVTGVAVENEEDNSFTFDPVVTDAEAILKNIKIEATSAKAGDVATLKISQAGNNSVSVEVAKVVDYKVIVTVDEDEDVPVIYSGVDVNNTGLTDDSDHESLEVTVKESFPGAWSMRQGFDFTLPEGVYVTAVDVTGAANFLQNKLPADENDWKDAFYKAYQDGDHMNFEFGKRVFDDVNVDLATKSAELTFVLTLVADPTFEGDVVLGFEGALVDKSEVTIAKFVKPYTVKAEQNDVIIDYRNTEVPTAIVVTEAEEGLWDKGATFTFSIDRGDYIEFEDDATFEVNEGSDMEVKSVNNALSFKVSETSDGEAATVTIKDIELFLDRSVPAGKYDLALSTSMETALLSSLLYAPDHGSMTGGTESGLGGHAASDYNSTTHNDSDKDCYVGDVEDYSNTVKEAFVNIVTAGRDQDDASFTTKVVVPVGESYLISGETKVDLDAPAYVNAAGYTMLPVRAVAKALGVNNNNVLWNAEARTVTIMYGQRIITMTVGQKVVYVNGSALPATAAVEISKDRTFLGMRDLSTALGVTDITWDAATKTATMNGGGGK